MGTCGVLISAYIYSDPASFICFFNGRKEAWRGRITISQARLRSLFFYLLAYLGYVVSTYPVDAPRGPPFFPRRNSGEACEYVWGYWRSMIRLCGLLGECWPF